ncbi:MAG: hypothetical protein ACR2OO_11795 [Thermomicrobiales bacterium]
MTGYLLVMAGMAIAMIAVAVYVLSSAADGQAAQASPEALLMLGSCAVGDGELRAMLAKSLPSRLQIVDALSDPPLTLHSVDRQLAACAALGRAIVVLSVSPPFETPRDDIGAFEAAVGGLIQHVGANAGALMMLTIPRALDEPGSRNAALARLCHACGGQIVDVDDGSPADVAARIAESLHSLTGDGTDPLPLAEFHGSHVIS